MSPGAPSPNWAEFAAAWDIFRDPILCAGAAGAVLGLVGVHVVLRRLVFVTAGVTQAAGLGVALAFFCEIRLDVHVEPLVGAALLALLTTLLFSVDTRRLGIPRETFLGFAFALSGGGAILLGDQIMQEAHDIEAILFGSAVLVRSVDLAAVLLTGAGVLVVLLLFHRAIVFAGTDPEAAAAQGLPVRGLNTLTLVAAGLMAGVSARALGSLPVFAFSTLPAGAALVTGLSLGPAFAVAGVLGALSGGLGYLAAYFLQLPVGGSQTTVASMLFVVALLVGRFTRHRQAPPG